MTWEQLPYLFMLYGCGWVGIFTLSALLYRNAFQKVKELELTATEIAITRCFGMGHLYSALVGVASILVCTIAIPIKGSFMTIIAGTYIS